MSPHTQKVIVWGGRWASSLDRGGHLTIYTYITLHTLNQHNFICQVYFNKAGKKCLVSELCPTICDSMDYNAPSFSVRGISQARILEWVAISFSRASSQSTNPRMGPMSPALAGRFFTTEPPVVKISESKRSPSLRVKTQNNIKEHCVISHISSSLESIFFFRDENREFCSEFRHSGMRFFSFKEERYLEAFIAFPGTAIIGFDNYLIWGKLITDFFSSFNSSITKTWQNFHWYSAGTTFH